MPLSPKNRDHIEQLLGIKPKNKSPQSLLMDGFSWTATNDSHDYWHRVWLSVRDEGLSDIDKYKLRLMLEQDTLAPDYKLLPPTKRNSKMSTLYFHTASNTYGKYLAIDGQDRIVLEMKSGEIKAFKRDEIEEVTPYTVEVATASGHLSTYRSKEGAVKVGDLLILGDKSMTFARVKAVNTKNKGDYPLLTGQLLTSTPIESPDA